MIDAEFLPGNAQSFIWPFLGWVVNVNIVAQAHRDGKDRHYCLVMPIGDFQGGELVLYEQGLVFQLRNGDFVVFESGKTTHFNLRYAGERSSFVFHTDFAMKDWEENHPMGGRRKKNAPRSSPEPAKERKGPPSKKRTRDAGDLSDDAEDNLSQKSTSKKPRKTPQKARGRKSQAAEEKEGLALVREATLKMVEAEGENKAHNDSDSAHNDQHNNVRRRLAEGHENLDQEEEELLRDLGTKRREKTLSQDPSVNGSEDDDVEDGEEDEDDDESDSDNGYNNSSTDEESGEDDEDEESQDENSVGTGNATGAQKNFRKDRSTTTPVKTTTWIIGDIEKAYGVMTTRLAVKAREQLRVMICTEDAFPLSTVGQDTFVWDAMRRVVADDRDPGLRLEFGNLESALKVLAGKSSDKSGKKRSHDSELVQCLQRVTTFIWAGVAQMRGQIKDEAVRACERYFAFESSLFNNKGSDVADSVKWLLSGDPPIFTYGNIDLKAKTYDKDQVFGVPVVAIVISKTFFGKQGSASKAVYRDIFHALPVRLIALVFVAIDCCLTTFKKGWRKDIQFTDAAFQLQYKYYYEMLEDFKEKMPVFWQTLTEELRQKIKTLSGREIKDRVYNKNSKKGVDFAALEAAAIAKKGLQTEGGGVLAEQVPGEQVVEEAGEEVMEIAAA
ncbi:hypothetical protein DENSPDRAFT_851206 [Dentipellis sp. KUC8613]|nr:hypothetical protein DENSPDRAFT_851206 [Dentipellis sp. KUC8613]